jgi:MFS family permease
LTGVLWAGFAFLAVPGALAMLLLAQLRRRAPIVTEADKDDAGDAASAPPARRALRELRAAALGSDLPLTFHLFSISAALTCAGLMTFGVVSFRLVEDGIVAAAAVPLVYALAMAAGALAALGTGDLFDRWGGRVLLIVPPVVAAVPLGVYADQLWLVLTGIVAWGAATGVQDSTVKAYVADLVPARRRATAYGVFAAVQGMGAVAGGALAGALVEDNVPVLVVAISVLQGIAFALLLRSTRSRSERHA